MIFYILGCYGLTTIIVQSKIMKPFRMFFKKNVPFIFKLLNCMMCTGFWVGALTSIVFRYSISYFLFFNNTPNLFNLFSYIIFDAAFISGVVWLIYLIQLNLERHVKNEL